MAHLTTKQIKALNKAGLIAELSKHGYDAAALQGLKRDEIRHVMFTANRNTPTAVGGVKQTARAVKTHSITTRSPESTELLHVRDAARKRAKATGATETGHEAIELLNSMLDNATTREEKIQAYKVYLNNPETTKLGQRKRERATMEAMSKFLYEDSKKKPKIIYKGGKWQVKEYRARSKKWVTSAIDKTSNYFWKLAKRLMEEYPNFSSNEIIETVQANYSKMSYAELKNLLESKYQETVAETKSVLDGFNGQVEG